MAQERYGQEWRELNIDQQAALTAEFKWVEEQGKMRYGREWHELDRDQIVLLTSQYTDT